MHAPVNSDDIVDLVLALANRLAGRFPGRTSESRRFPGLQFLPATPGEAWLAEEFDFVEAFAAQRLPILPGCRECFTPSQFRGPSLQLLPHFLRICQSGAPVYLNGVDVIGILGGRR